MTPRGSSPWPPGSAHRARAAPSTVIRDADRELRAEGPNHERDGLSDAVDVGGKILAKPTDAQIRVMTAASAAAQARQIAGVSVAQVALYRGLSHRW